MKNFRFKLMAAPMQNLKKTEENDVSEASVLKKAELAGKKAQKTTRPSESPSESRSGPFTADGKS